MADNFEKVVKALIENNKSQEGTTDSVDRLNKTMADHFVFLKRQVKDQEEDTRETKKVKAVSKSSGGSLKDMLGIGGKRGLLGMLMPLTAGIAALSASMIGLRGWELGAIKKIKGMVTLPKVLNNGLLKIRNISLGMFGLTAEGLITKDAKGKFSRALPLTTQISNGMSKLRVKALSMFGLGADGKLITVADGKGKFKANIAGRITRAVSTMLSPLVNVAAGVTGFMGSKAGAFMKTIGGFAGKFGKLFLKILWPIGMLVSLFDGVKAYQSSDKDGFIGKLGDGVGGFLGSLVGAPFDLLKQGITWVIKKLFGVETNADGSIPEGQGMAGWIVKQLESFSFQETIKKITSGIFGVVEGAINWVKLLFSDPVEALKALAIGLFGAGKGLLDILWFPINSAIDWVTKKFGWRDDDAPKFSITDTLINWVLKFGSWFSGFLPNITALATKIKKDFQERYPRFSKLFFKDEADINEGALTGGSRIRAENAQRKIGAELTAMGSNFRGAGTQNYVVDGSTNSGDNISVVNVAPPVMPIMGATHPRALAMAHQRSLLN